MRKFKDGDTILIEPLRATAFPVIKDSIVDRSAFDRIQQAGGYISVNTSGHTVDANAIPINKHIADEPLTLPHVSAAGSVSQHVNPIAMLFTSAKVSQFALLPQGQVEAMNRVHNMVRPKWIWKGLAIARIQGLAK